MSSTDNESIGFVQTNDASSNVTNVAFSDVYFKLTGSDARVGVLLLNESPTTLSGISVKNSEFEATYVGAIAGFPSNVENISNITPNKYFLEKGRIEMTSTS